MVDYPKIMYNVRMDSFDFSTIAGMLSGYLPPQAANFFSAPKDDEGKDAEAALRGDGHTPNWNNISNNPVFRITAIAAVAFITLGSALTFLPFLPGFCATAGIVMLAVGAIVSCIALGMLMGECMGPPPKKEETTNQSEEGKGQQKVSKKEAPAEGKDQQKVPNKDAPVEEKEQQKVPSKDAPVEEKKQEKVSSSP